MIRKKISPSRKGERGIVIVLVAMVLLFIVAAMAALAIDIVTLYSARSEAQSAADAAALAGARMLANSGMTTRPLDTTLAANTEPLAISTALGIAGNNKVGGRNLNVSSNCSTDVCVSIDDTTDAANPRVTVAVSKNDLPTFFSRIWGRTAAGVRATATAEAYNPSGRNVTAGTAPPIGPSCVKPWLLPNKNPTSANVIFDPATGVIDPSATGLLGWNSVKSPGASGTTAFQSDCLGGDCTGGGAGLPVPANAWKYYIGDPVSFVPPTNTLRTCSAIALPTGYQASITSCVPVPISCNSIVNIDTSNVPTRAKQTADAVNCLTHAATNLGEGDVADLLPTPNPAPFTFEGGSRNPVVPARGKNVLVSDSIVTVPVIDDSKLTAASTTAQVIGFVQLFLNADGGPASDVDPAPVQVKIINLIGCGTNATGSPIVGNGASAVAVRLISP